MIGNNIGGGVELGRDISTDVFSDDEIMAMCKMDKVGRNHTDDIGIPTLVLAFSEPPETISEPVDLVLQALRDRPPEEAYEWSQKWGNTRVAANVTKGNESLFVDYQTSESHRYRALISSGVRPASQFFRDDQEDDRFEDPYTLLLNDSPTTFEGTVLMVERMVDELCWRLASYAHEYGSSKAEAYKIALEEIENQGLRVRFAEEADIIELKRQEFDTPVRIYGNIYGHGAVSNVIGAITRNHEYVTEHAVEMRSDNVAQTDEKLTLQNDFTGEFNQVAVMSSATLGKQPHAGHLSLDATVRTVFDAVDGDVKVFMGNDGGPRIAALVQSVMTETGLNKANAIDWINRGVLSEGTLATLYQNRPKLDPIASTDTSGLHMDDESRKWAKTLDDSAGIEEVGQTVPFVCSRVSESVQRDIIAAHAPKWLGFGFAVAPVSDESSKVHILESSGRPTAVTSRAMEMIMVASDLSLREVVYVDSDAQIAEAARLVDKTYGDRLLVRSAPGSAIGFNLKMASGTSGESPLIDDIELKTGNPLSSAMRVVQASQPMSKPNGKFGFYDFKDPNSLTTALAKSDQFASDLLLAAHDDTLPELLELEVEDRAAMSIKNIGLFKTTMGMLDHGAIRDIRVPFRQVPFKERSSKGLSTAADRLACQKRSGQTALFTAGLENLLNLEFKKSDLSDFLNFAGYANADDQSRYLTGAIEQDVRLIRSLSPLGRTIDIVQRLQKFFVAVDNGSLQNLRKLVINDVGNAYNQGNLETSGYLED